MIRIAVCDDKKIFVDIISRTVKEEFRGRNIDFTTKNFYSGSEFLNKHKEENFDVVFLDIVMPDMDGFDVAKEIVRISEKTLIVFVTTESSLVFDSLDFRPFHFIPKSSIDILTDRLKYVISKLEMQLIDSKSICFNLPYDEKKYLYPKDIVSIRSKANYYIINTKKKGEIQIRGRIDSAMLILPERLFARVHNRYIVNMCYIKKVDYPNLLVVMCDDTNVDISRSFKKDFMEKYNIYLRNYN